MHVSFQEGLPFLKSFVENARMNGAKEYQKVFIPDHTDTSSVNMTPYTTKQASSAFETLFNKEKEEKPEEKADKKTTTSYEER